ncbi:MAG: hypothetical protein FDZ72_13460 [Betaproteobacteria bacterium]|nr:MAG: hypothetical protein FDZ72_13460 [Betaproteobacteria bacterium]
MKLPKLLAGMHMKGVGIPDWRGRMIYRGYSVVNSLGIQGVLALGILSLCILFFFTTILSLHTELKSLTQRANRSVSVDVGRVNQSMASELAAYKDSLELEVPKPAALLGQLHSLSNAVGFRLSSAELQSVGSGANSYADMPSLVVSVEFEAGREAIVTYINAVLVAMPNSALEAVSLQRAKLAATTLQARLRFRFYVRAT